MPSVAPAGRPGKGEGGGTEPPPPIGIGTRIPRIVYVIPVIIVVIAVVVVINGGGNNGDDDAVSLPTTPTEAPVTTGSVGESTTLVEPVTTTTEALGICEAAAEQEYEIEFSSPAMPGGVIGYEYAQSLDAFNAGFPSPPFTWSGIPDAATELAIVSQWVPENRLEEIVNDPNLWDEGVPPGSSRWIVRGIDPTSSGLAGASPENPLPEGVVELDHTGGVVQIDGIPYANKFLGPDVSGRVYMFTLFALCDPQTGTPFDFTTGWLRAFAIETEWFFVEAQW